jgi:hypothetical protein
VLQGPSAVEVVYVAIFLIVLVNVVDLVLERTDLVVYVAVLTEPVSKRHDDEMRVWPDIMDFGNERDVWIVVLFVHHVVRRVVIVGPEINEDNICWLVCREVPKSSMIAMNVLRSAVGVLGLEPLVFLASRIASAVCIVQANAWRSGDAEINVS